MCPDLDSVDVVGGLAVPAVERQMGGPHDGLVLHWLSNNAELDPELVDSRWSVSTTRPSRPRRRRGRR